STATSLVAPTGTGIKVSFANSSTASVLRVQLAADTTGTTFWCYTVTGTSPLTIPYTSFTQQCYATPTGPAYAKQPILSVQLSVPGDSTGAKTLNVSLLSVNEY